MSPRAVAGPGGYGEMQTDRVALPASGRSATITIARNLVAAVAQCVPGFLKRTRYWRSVWRFVWLGPLVGGLPYNVMVIGIPFSYALGALPALLAGLLYAAWYAQPTLRKPSWPWRLAAGGLCGALSCLLVGGMVMSRSGALAPLIWFVPHGVFAGACLAASDGADA